MSYYIEITAGPDCSPNPPAANQPFSFTWTVTNTGDAPAEPFADSFQQGFYVAYRFTNQYGRSIAEDAPFFNTLAPGESATNTQTVSFSEGVYTLTLYADPAEQVANITGNGQGGTVSIPVPVTA